MNLQGHILCVFAHPDDESYIVGGTIARATAQGAEVTVISVTRGDKGFQHITDPSEKERLTHIREQELKNASAILGVKEVILWDYPDGGLDSLGKGQKELINTLLNVINTLNPDTIITFGPDGVSGHRDHIAIGKIVKKLLTIQPFNNQISVYGVTIPCELTTYLQKVLASRQRTMDHYNHGMFHDAPFLSQVEKIDISNFVEKKFAAMRAHLSQNPEGLITAYTSQPTEFWEFEYFLPLTTISPPRKGERKRGCQ
jgi:LmbE family N-acetylglucosaminyl deacetylase